MLKSNQLKFFFLVLLIGHIALIVYYLYSGRFKTLSFQDGSANLLIILSSSILMYISFFLHFNTLSKTNNKEKKIN